MFYRFVDDVRLKLRPFYERIYGPTPEVDESDQNIEMLDTILEQDGISLAEGHFGSSEEPRHFINVVYKQPLIDCF